jgi:hypothetical protein
VCLKCGEKVPQDLKPIQQPSTLPTLPSMQAPLLPLMPAVVPPAPLLVGIEPNPGEEHSTSLTGALPSHAPAAVGVLSPVLLAVADASSTPSPTQAQEAPPASAHHAPTAAHAQPASATVVPPSAPHAPVGPVLADCAQSFMDAHGELRGQSRSRLQADFSPVLAALEGIVALERAGPIQAEDESKMSQLKLELADPSQFSEVYRRRGRAKACPYDHVGQCCSSESHALSACSACSYPDCPVVMHTACALISATEEACSSHATIPLFCHKHLVSGPLAPTLFAHAPLFHDELVLQCTHASLVCVLCGLCGSRRSAPPFACAASSPPRLDRCSADVQQPRASPRNRLELMTARNG